MAEAAIARKNKNLQLIKSTTRTIKKIEIETKDNLKAQLPESGAVNFNENCTIVLNLQIVNLTFYTRVSTQ